MLHAQKEQLKGLRLASEKDQIKILFVDYF